MSDPHDATQPNADQQFNPDPDEQDAVGELDVRAEDADKVKGGRREDPCAGGQVSKKLG